MNSELSKACAPEIDNYLARHLNKNLQRYAVQRQIQCHCGQILDCRTALFLQFPSGNPLNLPAGSVCLCPACADKLPDKWIETLKEKAETDPDNYTWIDGREIHKRAKRSKANDASTGYAKSGYWYLQRHYPSFKAAYAAAAETVTVSSVSHTIFYLPRAITPKEIKRAQLQGAKQAPAYFGEPIEIQFLH